jgi:hypothetical protein
VPDLSLSYGQVLWLLLSLGFGSGVAESTFHEYVKSLRKLGIPFGRKSAPAKSRVRANYLYPHVMELTVILSLRVYHVVPDAVLSEVDRHREQLERLYRRAYEYRASGRGAPICLTTESGRQIELRGLFMDLGIRFSGGRMVRFGPPRLLSPIQVLMQFARRDRSADVFLPINLSLLAERVVRLALSPPRKRRRSPPGKVRFPGLSLGVGS